MTPDSSSSDETPLPKKHRPNLGQLSQETTERDLWDFDDELGATGEPGDSPSAEDRKPAFAVPPRKPEIPKSKKKGDTPERPESEEVIRTNINRPKPKVRKGIAQQSIAAPEQEFSDLDQWEESPAPEREAAVPIVPAPPEPAAVPPVDPPVPEMAAPAEAEADAQLPAGDAASDLDEFTPHAPANAQPLSLHPKFTLTKFEKAGLAALAVILILVAGLAYWFSINRIPNQLGSVTESDFPVEGKRVTVKSARTYWRAPVTTGEEADTVRRGTRLIPVIELNTQARNAALRVIFRDDTGAAVGDIATREIHSDTMTFAATAGFDEVGMHAAYRTGSVDPWTVEVLEGLPGASRGEDFVRLFKIEISALRR